LPRYVLPLRLILIDSRPCQGTPAYSSRTVTVLLCHFCHSRPFPSSPVLATTAIPVSASARHSSLLLPSQFKQNKVSFPSLLLRSKTIPIHSGRCSSSPLLPVHSLPDRSYSFRSSAAITLLSIIVQNRFGLCRSIPRLPFSSF
jgi:hypothetical protein